VREAEDDEGTGDVVVLGRSGVRTGCVLLAVGVSLVVLFVGAGLVAALTYPVLITGATAWQLLVRGGDTVRLEADALVVVSGRRRTCYAWSDVLEVAWRRHGDFWVGPGPVVRVRGGPYDQPGPNFPSQVASLPVFGHRAGAAAEAALAAAARRHGVRFDPDMERDIATGRRRPQDPERHAGR
jgi:hypothetical protein